MIVEANLIEQPKIIASEVDNVTTVSGCALSKFDPNQSIASTSIAEETFELYSQSSLESASTSTNSTQTIIHVASDYCPATLSSSLGGTEAKSAEVTASAASKGIYSRLPQSFDLDSYLSQECWQTWVLAST